MLQKMICVLALVVGLPSMAGAQEWEMPKPTDQHLLLKKFVGTWAVANKTTAESGQEMACEGTMKAEMLGDFWVVNRLTGDMQGAQMTGIQTLGFDQKKKVFVGTWVDSMTDYMWHYEGRLEKEGKQLVMAAEGPSFTDPGKTTQFEDRYEFVSDDLIHFESGMQDSSGKWILFMTGEMKRIKSAEKKK